MPAGSEAKERPFPSGVDGTCRRAVKPTPDEKLYFPGYNRNGITKLQSDSRRKKIKTTGHIKSAVVCAMAMLISIVTTGKVWEESSSLLEVCYWSFLFRHYGDVCAALTDIMETAKKLNVLTCQHDRRQNANVQNLCLETSTSWHSSPSTLSS